MPEHQRSALTARDESPDSVIFTLDANFSLFSSASASVDRCSFASDAHDRDSLASEISLHLSGHEESSSGPDLHPHPNKQTTVYSNNHSNSHSKTTHTRLSRKAAPTHTKALLDDTTITTNTTTGVNSALGDDSDRLLDLDSARSSFSLALKECQDRRSRSEAAKKVERRRPASLDLNNVAAVSSPRFANVKKSSLPSRKSGTFPSPGTPNYLHSTVSMHKGWSSERVPLHSTANRRHVGNAAMLPLANGRTLPSKWEDAERWIFSPVSGDGVTRSSLQQNRKPKSKSGPLGPPGVAYYSLYSPAVPVFDGGSIGNFIAGSPFSAGVIGPDSLAFRSSNADLGLGFPLRNEPCMARSVSVHGCSDTLGHTASLPSQEEKIEGVKDAVTDISRAVSRRDMATQMSPEGSNNSSPSRRVSFSASTPSVLPTEEMQGINSSRADVRDVQVDERVTVTRWTKKHRSRNHGKTSDIVDDWRKKSSDAQSCSWDVSEAAKGISKAKREEAKITAWENLQKAKAEAAIRKLEMKLEKKRSSSMDKIMNKLRSAQKKAQEMRSSVLANQANQVSGASHKVVSFHRTRQMGSLSGCFTCHAF